MIKKAIRSVVRKLGYDIIRCHKEIQPGTHADFEKLHHEIIGRVSPYTVTSQERIHALIESTRYILKNNIKGAFVECGVYKGGSMMAVALTLLAYGRQDRDLYLFDTFEGMPSPGEKDIDLWGKSAMEIFTQKKISETSSTWLSASLNEVRSAMAQTLYPIERIHFIKGLIENTVPDRAPEMIALLRLDTDWYQSIIHSMKHLYKRLSTHGIVIVDDYGHFQGAREAIDEFFYKKKMPPFLHRIDYTGRLIIKED